MGAIMLMLVGRAIWPASIPYPALGVHGMQAGDEFRVGSIYPYAAIIAAMLIGVASLGFPNWWAPAVTGVATIIVIWVYGPAANAEVTFAAAETFGDKKKISLYEQVISESSQLISRLRRPPKNNRAEVIDNNDDVTNAK
jgi:hypothetical protein